MKQQYSSMAGKTCVVTGASSGIGKATATVLACLGAEVIIVNSNHQRGLAALQDIRSRSGNDRIHQFTANLSSQAEIRRLSGELKLQFPRIHVLINVAGSMFRRIQSCPDQLEMNFALNYLSDFLLANLLMDTLLRSAPARIINVSSVAHWWGHIDFASIRNPSHYSMFGAYGDSKLAIILFTRELASRLEDTGVTAYSVHPGIVATKIIDKVIDHPMVDKIVRLLFLSPEESADNLVYLAASEDDILINGEYYANNKPGRCSKISRDMSLARKLWTLSEKCLIKEDSLLINEEKSEEICA